jgi:hypothetical protein
MYLSPIDPYLDIVMQNLSDLIIEAAVWPEAMQAHLYLFWANLDHMMNILQLPQLPVQEIRACLSEIWCELEALEQVIFNGDVSSHLDMLRRSLISISHIVDELLCSRFEFLAAHITSRLEVSPSRFMLPKKEI